MWGQRSPYRYLLTNNSTNTCKCSKKICESPLGNYAYKLYVCSIKSNKPTRLIDL